MIAESAVTAFSTTYLRYKQAIDNKDQNILKACK